MSDVTIKILEKIDADLDITATKDPEVKNVWFPLGIRLNYTAVISPAHTFISSMGRLKYLQPEYQALLDTKQTALAISWYEENKDFYHPLAAL